MWISKIISTLWNPAILLAGVPFVRLIIEFAFRRAYKNSTFEALTQASRSSTESNVKNAVSDENVRKSLALYVDNDSDLEEYFQTSLFSALSLVVWLLTARNKHTYQQDIDILLLFVIVAVLVVVGIWSRKRYEPARLSAAKYPKWFSYVLALLIVILEVLAALGEQ